MEAIENLSERDARALAALTAGVEAALVGYFLAYVVEVTPFGGSRATLAAVFLVLAPASFASHSFVLRRLRSPAADEGR